MQQVAVGRVNLDPVHSGADRIAGGDDVLRDDVLRVGCDGYRVRGLALGRAHLAVDRDRARPYGVAATVDCGVGDAAAVHQLHDDEAAALVHRVGDPAPAGDLLGRDDAGLARIGLAFRARVGALRDDESRGRTLAVVLHDEIVRHAVGSGAHTGEGGHHHAVAEGERAEMDGGEKLHGASFVGNRGCARGAPFAQPGLDAQYSGPTGLPAGVHPPRRGWCSRCPSQADPGHRCRSCGRSRRGPPRFSRRACRW